MCGQRNKSSVSCHCRGGFFRGFVKPQLLLELAKQPAHGYELIEILGQKGNLPSSDPGNLYRLLRGLEEEGLVHSNWDTSGGGPARRVYELTNLGLENLDAWAAKLQEERSRLDKFLVDYKEINKDEIRD